MNKSGHVALAMAVGSGYLYAYHPTSTWIDWAGMVVTLGVTGITALAPDIDHKMSTVSNIITPFSTQTRKQLKKGAILLALVGLFLYLLPFLPIHLPLPIPEKLIRSAPLWLAASILCIALMKIRDLVLIGLGAMLLYAYYLYDWGWFAAFIGIALFILPIVRHRGIIHTPEFALCLTVGIMSLVNGSVWYLYAAGLGVVIGWWSHLAGDVFGREGIRSLFIPIIKLALNLFSNGGKAEKSITTLSWVASFGFWALMIYHNIKF